MSEGDIQGDTATTIASHRKRRHWTLADVAKRSGLSAAHLSRIERGERTPTLGVLFRLARAYDVSVSELIGETDASPTVTRHHILSNADGRVVHRPIYTSAPGSFVQAVLVKLGPDARTPPARHDGMESVHVLSGALSINVGQRTWQLMAGESIEFDASAEHTLSCGADGAEVLLFSSMPQEDESRP